MTDTETKKIIMSGSAWDTVFETGKKLTHRRFELGFKYESYDNKDKNWTESTRRVSRFSLREANFEERRQLQLFEGNQNLRLLSNWMYVFNIS